MSWFRRGKQQRPVNPHAAEIHTARRQLRDIEYKLSRLNTRTDIDAVRQLTGSHQAWREHLARLGVNHPAPQIDW